MTIDAAGYGGLAAGAAALITALTGVVTNRPKMAEIQRRLDDCERRERIKDDRIGNLETVVILLRGFLPGGEIFRKFGPTRKGLNELAKRIEESGFLEVVERYHGSDRGGRLG